jgi:hypothetical protein
MNGKRISIDRSENAGQESAHISEQKIFYRAGNKKWKDKMRIHKFNIIRIKSYSWVF